MEVDKEEPLKQPIPIFLLCLAMLATCARTTTAWQSKTSLPQQASNPNSKAEKIKSQVNKIGTDAKITAKLVDGRTYHGKIKLIDQDNFQIDEVDLKQVITINYAETKKVYEGYGGKGFGGKRVGQHSTLIGFAALAGIITVALVFVATQTK